jgi:hypothetical protein
MKKKEEAVIIVAGGWGADYILTLAFAIFSKMIYIHTTYETNDDDVVISKIL